MSNSAALVEFDAPPVSVAPTDNATTSESDGTAVTVTADGGLRQTVTTESEPASRWSERRRRAACSSPSR